MEQSKEAKILDSFTNGSVYGRYKSTTKPNCITRSFATILES